MTNQKNLSTLEKMALKTTFDTWVYMRFVSFFLLVASTFVVAIIIANPERILSGTLLILFFLSMAYVLFLESIPCRLRPELYRD